MKLEISNLGKRVGSQWIFRHLHFTNSSNYIAVTGPNGSGKSSLLKVLSGWWKVSEGSFQLTPQSGRPTISEENLYRKIAFTAPYIHTFGEFTLKEAIRFQAAFRSFQNDIPLDEIGHEIQLRTALEKPVKALSSGMRQRLRVGLAVMSDTPILLLDEPCTNLDKKGVGWYHQLIEKYASNRLVMVASNREEEYLFCDEQIKMSNS